MWLFVLQRSWWCHLSGLCQEEQVGGSAEPKGSAAVSGLCSRITDVRRGGSSPETPRAAQRLGWGARAALMPGVEQFVVHSPNFLVAVAAFGG